MNAVRHAVRFLALLLPLLSTDALAQTREFQGTVRDQSGHPIRGAVVQLENVETLRVLSFLTPPSGQYHFAGMVSFEDYKLRAHYRGYWSSLRRVSHLDAGSRKPIDLTVRLPDER